MRRYLRGGGAKLVPQNSDISPEDPRGHRVVPGFGVLPSHAIAYNAQIAMHTQWNESRVGLHRRRSWGLSLSAAVGSTCLFLDVLGIVSAHEGRRHSLEPPVLPYRLHTYLACVAALRGTREARALLPAMSVSERVILAPAERSESAEDMIFGLGAVDLCTLTVTGPLTSL